MQKRTFLIESLKNIKTVGTISKSSVFLCKEIVKQIPWKSKMVLLELGAGDGAITKHLLRKMNEDDVLIAFEMNTEFCARLREINDKRLIVIEENANTIDRILAKHKIKNVDHIISAIPFVLLENKETEHIIRSCIHYLASSGLFIQVHYSTLAKKLYEKIFKKIDIKFVPFNVPPVFLHIMQK